MRLSGRARRPERTERTNERMNERTNGRLEPAHELEHAHDQPDQRSRLAAAEASG